MRLQNLATQSHMPSYNDNNSVWVLKVALNKTLSCPNVEKFCMTLFQGEIHQIFFGKKCGHGLAYIPKKFDMEKLDMEIQIFADENSIPPQELP